MKETFQAPLVFWAREYPVRIDLIPDKIKNVYPKVPIGARVSSLIDVLQLVGTHELLGRPWERFLLLASRISNAIAWCRDEVEVWTLSHLELCVCHLVNFLPIFCFSQLT